MSAISSNLPRLQSTPNLPPERSRPAAPALYGRTTRGVQPAPRTGNLFAMPNEPEDARITGGTRSLERRLLALNLAKPVSRFSKVPGTLSA
ncbi:MAG: hypothetical protein M3O02_05855 [Acidobacteriota bacterium]|nr:hypothetical protein [Acidobacteriota bacterium]